MCVCIIIAITVRIAHTSHSAAICCWVQRLKSYWHAPLICTVPMRYRHACARTRMSDGCYGRSSIVHGKRGKRRCSFVSIKFCTGCKVWKTFSWKNYFHNHSQFSLWTAISLHWSIFIRRVIYQTKAEEMRKKLMSISKYRPPPTCGSFWRDGSHILAKKSPIVDVPFSCWG